MDPTRDEPGHVPQGHAQEPNNQAATESASASESSLVSGGDAVSEGDAATSAATLETSSHLEGDSSLESLGANDPALESAALSAANIPDSARPSFLFFGVVAAISLIADISTKVWAEVVINERGFEPIKIIGDNLAITLAYNQGGAWGLFSTADPMVRKPFFLCVSAFAIFFIISLYSRLHPTQRALKWGLPLVLGGALGNLSDRITRSQVIDFIDYHGDWVMSLNSFVHKYVSSWAVTDHWPTFNIADVAICIGVGLMAVDMFTHRPRALQARQVTPSVPPPTEQVAQ